MHKNMAEEAFFLNLAKSARQALDPGSLLQVVPEGWYKALLLTACCKRLPASFNESTRNGCETADMICSIIGYSKPAADFRLHVAYGKSKKSKQEIHDCVRKVVDDLTKICIINVPGVQEIQESMQDTQKYLMLFAHHMSYVQFRVHEKKNRWNGLGQQAVMRIWNIKYEPSPMYFHASLADVSNVSGCSLTDFYMGDQWFPVAAHNVSNARDKVISFMMATKVCRQDSLLRLIDSYVMEMIGRMAIFADQNEITRYIQHHHYLPLATHTVILSRR
jgi:hypothetical protein